MKPTKKWRCEKLGVTVEARYSEGLSIIDIGEQLGGDWVCGINYNNKKICFDKRKYSGNNAEESVFEFVQISEPENIDEFISSLKLKQNEDGDIGAYEIDNGMISCQVRDCNDERLAYIEFWHDLDFEKQKIIVTNFFDAFGLLEE